MARLLHQKQRDTNLLCALLLDAEADELAIANLWDKEREYLRGLSAALVAECEVLRPRPSAADVRDDAPRCVDDPEAYLEALAPGTCYSRFRFYKDEILQLYHLVVVPCLDDPSLPPDTVRDRDGSVHHALKGLLVLLRRLKAPIDWDELQWEFGLTSNRLGQLFARMVFLMLNNHGHLLQGITMFRPHFQTYANAIAARGAAMYNCVGFVDGTFWPVARPSLYEWRLYNGKYRCHGIKFQNVVGPNGMVMDHCGPYLGSEHDSSMLGYSGFLDRFAGCVGLLGDPDHFAIFGDPAYSISNYLLRPHGGAWITARQEEFNLGTVSCEDQC
jgi:hypothetical protein